MAFNNFELNIMIKTVSICMGPARAHIQQGIEHASPKSKFTK